MFLLPKLKNFEAISHNARRKLEIPMEPAMPCVAVPGGSESRPLALIEGRPKRKDNRIVWTPKVFSVQRANTFP